MRWTPCFLLLACSHEAANERASKHPEWGQCGYAIHQRFTVERGVPRCEAGELEACVDAAEVYREGGYSVPHAPGVAAALAWKACSGGNDRGCTLLGELIATPNDAGLRHPVSCYGEHLAECTAKLCAFTFDPPGLGDGARVAMKCSP